MPTGTQLMKPEVKAKSRLAREMLYPITRKAVNWAEANGYWALIRDVDHFMLIYRQATAPAEARAAKRAAKLKSALAAKLNGHG